MFSVQITIDDLTYSIVYAASISIVVNAPSLYLGQLQMKARRRFESCIEDYQFFIAVFWKLFLPRRNIVNVDRNARKMVTSS